MAVGTGDGSGREAMCVHLYPQWNKWGGCSQKNVQKEKNLFILCQCVFYPPHNIHPLDPLHELSSSSSLFDPFLPLFDLYIHQFYISSDLGNPVCYCLKSHMQEGPWT